MNEIECAECATSIETEGGVNRWIAHAFADRMGWKSYRVENEWKVSCPACLRRWSDAARRNRELWDFREYWNLRSIASDGLRSIPARLGGAQ